MFTTFPRPSPLMFLDLSRIYVDSTSHFSSICLLETGPVSDGLGNWESGCLLVLGFQGVLLVTSRFLASCSFFCIALLNVVRYRHRPQISSLGSIFLLTTLDFLCSTGSLGTSVHFFHAVRSWAYFTSH
jgi:hypothetical protein